MPHSERQAGAEIEVTPEMVEAGKFALMAFAAKDYEAFDAGLRDILKATFGREAISFSESKQVES